MPLYRARRDGPIVQRADRNSCPADVRNLSAGSSMRFLRSAKDVRACGIPGVVGKEAQLFDDLSTSAAERNEFVNQHDVALFGRSRCFVVYARILWANMLFTAVLSASRPGPQTSSAKSLQRITVRFCATVFRVASCGCGSSRITEAGSAL